MAFHIYPETKFLKIGMICSSLLGIFPWQLLFENNEKFRKLYLWYSKIMLSSNILFTVTMYTQFLHLIKEDPIRLDEISRNVCITLIYTMTIVRQFIIKTHPGFRKLLEHIIDTEKYLLLTKEREVLNIFQKCLKVTTTNLIRYAVWILAACIVHYVRPFLVTVCITVHGNQTVELNTFPVSAWFPFDEQLHFVTGFIWNITNVAIGASFTTYTDVLMFQLMMYPIGQLKILQHVLKHFDEYKENIRRQFPNERDERKIACITFRCCVEKHWNIIEYMDNFNAAMSVFMVLDFFQSSLQFSSTIIQLLVDQISLFDWVFVGILIGYSLNRLMMYYYYSNEVLLLSENLGLSIWESNWYEQPSEVKFMMIMFMIRSTRPLKFDIGPFGFMSLSTFITILKASYSYITLMHSIENQVDD